MGASETTTREMLFSILNVPKRAYSLDSVWASLRLSHSSLRLSRGTNLVYYGVKLGTTDMGVVVTVDDRVDGSFNDRGIVYVNRYVPHFCVNILISYTSGKCIACGLV